MADLPLQEESRLYGGEEKEKTYWACVSALVTGIPTGPSLFEI